MSEILEIIGKRLKEAILVKGYLTVESFANENGFEKSAIGKIIQGKRAPQIDTLIRITDSLGITVNDLYSPSKRASKSK